VGVERQPGRDTARQIEDPDIQCCTTRVPAAVERMRQLAMDRATEYVRRHPGREGAHARSILGSRLATMGRPEEGLEQVKHAIEAVPDDGRLHYNAACFYARERRVEDAIRELKEGTRNLTSFMGDWPRHDPDMENVRDHPEFVKMFGRPPEKEANPAS
jgi:predicted Zn-dependent protease